MSDRHVLVLRLYRREGAERLFVCEDPEAGQQIPFVNGEELWHIVERRFEKQARSRGQNRAAVPSARKPTPDAKEPS
jgi:hypothetical protein